MPTPVTPSMPVRGLREALLAVAAVGILVISGIFSQQHSAQASPARVAVPGGPVPGGFAAPPVVDAGLQPSLPPGMVVRTDPAGHDGTTARVRVKVENHGPLDANEVVVRCGLYDASGKYVDRLVAPLFRIAGRGGTAAAVYGYDTRHAAGCRLMAVTAHMGNEGRPADAIPTPSHTAEPARDSFPGRAVFLPALSQSLNGI